MNLPTRQRGVGFWEVVITILIVTVVLIVISVVMGLLLGGGDPPPPQAIGTENVCYTYCSGLVEFQCGDNDMMGACLGFWDCSAEIGAHQCQ